MLAVRLNFQKSTAIITYEIKKVWREMVTLYRAVVKLDVTAVHLSRDR